MDEKQVEKEATAKNLNAPRIKPEQIDALIVGEEYHVFGGKTTVCCLALQNGFHVTGVSSAVSVENFDKDMGRKISRRNARDQIWQLAGYLLQQREFENEAKGPRP